jgi:hypothetical protein
MVTFLLHRYTVGNRCISLFRVQLPLVKRGRDSDVDYIYVLLQNGKGQVFERVVAQENIPNYNRAVS